MFYRNFCHWEKPYIFTCKNKYFYVIFTCVHIWYLTRSLRSLVRYRCEHSKINSISPRAQLLFSLYSPCEVNHVETSIKLQIGPSMRCERKICFLLYLPPSTRPLPALFPPFSFSHLCNKRSYWIQVTNQSKTLLKCCASVISTPGRILQYVWKAVLIFI